MAFNVIQYNLFGRPYTVSHDGQNERLERIPAALVAVNITFDVATFAEADNDDEVNLMAKAFAKAGYKYRTSVIRDHKDKSLVNGGVIIGSKWPILREDQIVYRNACAGSDCLAAKGVKYARVMKTDPETGLQKVFNIFATHMQAWYTREKIEIRVKQAQQMAAFIASQQIPANEPVVLAGDFNDDLVRYPGTVKVLLDTLNATMPPLDGEIRFTSNPSSNVLVGRDGAAGDCQDGYEKSWGPLDATDTHNPTPATRVLRKDSWPPSTDTGAAVLPFFTNPGNLSYCPCCPQE